MCFLHVSCRDDRDDLAQRCQNKSWFPLKILGLGSVAGIRAVTFVHFYKRTESLLTASVKQNKTEKIATVNESLLFSDLYFWFCLGVNVIILRSSNIRRSVGSFKGSSQFVPAELQNHFMPSESGMAHDYYSCSVIMSDLIWPGCWFSETCSKLSPVCHKGEKRALTWGSSYWGKVRERWQLLN